MEIEQCFICGSGQSLERHHIFTGSRRKKSEKYGLVVYLCDTCHRNGKHAAHKDASVMRRLQAYGQRKYMDEQGKSAEDFIKEFGKNYL